MKLSKVIIILLLVIAIGYILYLGIGMSYTYSSIKEYHFSVNKNLFDRKLAARIASSNGWSFQKKDSIKRDDEYCYWASLFYEANGQDLMYTIKYCFDTKTLNKNGECATVGIVSVIDYINKTDSYRISDNNVKELLHKLDSTILNDLAPVCSGNSN